MWTLVLLSTSNIPPQMCNLIITWEIMLNKHTVKVNHRHSCSHSLTSLMPSHRRSLKFSHNRSHKRSLSHCRRFLSSSRSLRRSHGLSHSLSHGLSRRLSRSLSRSLNYLSHRRSPHHRRNRSLGYSLSRNRSLAHSRGPSGSVSCSHSRAATWSIRAPLDSRLPARLTQLQMGLLLLPASPLLHTTLSLTTGTLCSNASRPRAITACSHRHSAHLRHGSLH